jgi:hypothetical protein
MTLESLKKRFRYKPESGDLYLRLDPKFKEKEKLVTSISTDGYLQANPKEAKRALFAHRVAYQLYHNLETIQGVIDHLDQNKTNNKIVNLRLTTRAENNRNLAMRRSNKSGVSGVYLLPSGKWRAQIRHNNVNNHLGCFDTIEEAAAARRKAIEALGFNKNHA